MCFRVYKAQFLKRMGRLLDNLPEKDISTASQCTTPLVHSSSASLREIDSADSTPRNLPSTSNPTKPTCVPSLAVCSDSIDSNSASCETTPEDTTSSVRFLSTTSQLQSSVSNTDQSRLLSTNYYTSACVTAQNGSHSTSRGQLYNVCLTSQQQSWSQSMTGRQLPHSRLEVSITRDILPSCICKPNSSSRGGLSCITAPSNSGRSGPSCITTPSSSGRGGLSAYDSTSHHVHSASSETLDVLRLTSASQQRGQSHVSNRPLVSSDRQQTATTRSAAYSDWITTRTWVFWSPYRSRDDTGCLFLVSSCQEIATKRFYEFLRLKRLQIACTNLYIIFF